MTGLNQALLLIMKCFRVLKKFSHSMNKIFRNVR